MRRCAAGGRRWETEALSPTVPGGAAAGQARRRPQTAFGTAPGGELPSDRVPGGAALALWFLLRRPEVFNEVFLRHEIQEVDCWRAAQAPPGLALDGLEGKAAALAASIQEFFRLRRGTGRF